MDGVHQPVGQRRHLVGDGRDALRGRGAPELAQVPDGRGQDQRPGHVQRAVGLDVLDLDVALPVDLDAGGQLALGQDAELREELLGLGRGQGRERVDGRLVVRQPALRSLGVPFLGVVVALEEDLLVRLDDPRQDPGQPLEVAVLELLELVGQLRKRVRHGAVENRLGPVDGGGRADRAELELVARERERRGPVAVGGVLGQDRQ